MESLETPRYLIAGSQTSLRLALCFGKYVINNLGLQIVWVIPRVIHGQLLRFLRLKFAYCYKMIAVVYVGKRLVLQNLDFLNGTFSILQIRRLLSLAGDPQHRVRDFDQVAKYFLSSEGFP